MFNFLRQRKINTPDQAWKQEPEHRYTPDLVQLEDKQDHLVFVCGEEQPKHHKSWLMEPAPTIAEAFTAKEDYILWRKYLGKETVAVPLQAEVNHYVQNIKLNGEPAYPPARIKGCLFLVKPKHFLELDEYKENGVVFSRQRIDILIPYTVVQDNAEVKAVKYLEVWTYLGKEDFWTDFDNPDAALFQPVSPTRGTFLGKIPMSKYYHFGQKDYGKGLGK